jgi:hypothetical protein
MPSEYRLKDPARGLLGPVRLETVRDLVEAGVVADVVEVSKDGGPWKPVRSFTELYNKPAPGPITRSPTFSGDLGKNTFFKVFYRFSANHASGMLELQQGDRQRQIYLEAGEPVYITSTVPGERIGEFLVQRGKLGADELKVAVEALPKHGNHLGRVLLQLGLIEPSEFYEELRELQIHRLMDLCGWESGRYAFYDGVRNDAEKQNLELSANGLIMRAARAMSDELLNRRLAPYVRHVPHRQPNLELDRGAFVFSSIEQRAFEAVDGRRTLSEIFEHVGAARERRRAALVVVYVLFEVDAVTFG